MQLQQERAQRQREWEEDQQRKAAARDQERREREEEFMRQHARRKEQYMQERLQMMAQGSAYDKGGANAGSASAPINPSAPAHSAAEGAAEEQGGYVWNADTQQYVWHTSLAPEQRVQSGAYIWNAEKQQYEWKADSGGAQAEATHQQTATGQAQAGGHYDVYQQWPGSSQQVGSAHGDQQQQQYQQGSWSQHQQQLQVQSQAYNYLGAPAPAATGYAQAQQAAPGAQGWTQPQANYNAAYPHGPFPQGQQAVPGSGAPYGYGQGRGPPGPGPPGLPGPPRLPAPGPPQQPQFAPMGRGGYLGPQGALAGRR